MPHPSRTPAISSGLLNGFESTLTSSKWASLAKRFQTTARRPGQTGHPGKEKGKVASVADRDGRWPSLPCPNATASKAELGTKWEQDWQYQPNAPTKYVRQGSFVTASQSKPSGITATCFQYHGDGRRAGLKIRSWQQGVGSSGTLGISNSG
jgi:hypothetical protein